MDTLIDFLAGNALAATALAALVVIIGKICRHPGVMHILWIVVLLKFILPPVVALPLGLAETHQVVAQNDTGKTLIDGFRLNASVVASPTKSGEDLTLDPGMQGHRNAGYKTWFFGVWVTGSVIWLVISIFHVAAFHRLIRNATPASDSVLHRTEQICQRLGLTRIPSIVILVGRISPVVWPLSKRVTVILPAEFFQRMDVASQETLLAHELAHIRRGDHWIRFIEVLVTGLYWWHPVLWWARRQLHELEEQCCDAEVLRVLPGSARNYANALVDTVEFLRVKSVRLPIATTGAHPAYLLKRRIVMIMSGESKVKLSPVHVFGVSVFALAALPFVVVRAQNDDAKPADLFASVLIAPDLQDAKNLMTIYDPNEDGYIDASEQKRIPWRSDISKFDLNRDGKLTHLEVAVRQSKLRGDSGVTFIDRKNASKFMGRKDRNGNNQLDPDEIALGWPKNPESFDKNGDGIISLIEIAAQFASNRGYRREVGIEGVDQTEAARLRNQFDTDNDGKLAPDEWPAANLPREPKQYDENGDGLLSNEELATLLAQHRLETGLSNSDQLQARRLIRIADINQDGRVTQDELLESSSFNPSARDLVKKYDANNDGEVTLAEIETSLGQERKEKGFSDEDLVAARRLLMRHDENRSNALEESELFEAAGTGQLSVKSMRGIDSNNDKKLSLDEIAKHLAKENN